MNTYVFKYKFLINYFFYKHNIHSNSNLSGFMGFHFSLDTISTKQNKIKIIKHIFLKKYLILFNLYDPIQS